MTWPSSNGSSMKTLAVTMCPSQMISSGDQLGVDLYFGTVVGPWVYRMNVMLFMYLCDVASVSQLCIFSPLIIYMGCCEDYLTCDIAFNVVMPLSRASTRRRYSRIEGTTLSLSTLHLLEFTLWICVTSRSRLNKNKPLPAGHNHKTCLSYK